MPNAQTTTRRPVANLSVNRTAGRATDRDANGKQFGEGKGDCGESPQTGPTLAECLNCGAVLRSQDVDARDKPGHDGYDNGALGE